MSVQPRLLPTSPRLAPRERLEVLLLSSWFFVITMTLWLLKPIRTAALLTHLGASDLPALRLGSAVVICGVVLGYSRVVNRLSRLQVALAVNAVFLFSILAVWFALSAFEAEVGSQRWFVWSVFCLVDAYASVMVSTFWMYTNDVVSRRDADRLYAPIGVGGILGGMAGGAATDAFVHLVGPVHMLLICVAGLLLSGGIAITIEAVFRPAPRVSELRRSPALTEMFEGARRVLRSDYLLWMVGIVVAYESAAALTDFVVNVVFERSFQSEVELAQMYGRLGWIVGATALASQLLLVPALLPFKRLALLVPPVVMVVTTLSLAILPVVTLALVVAASDRGLNYSLQQVTKETLYVPLGDAERYKAKAFIDIFVDRAAKALSSMLLVAVLSFTGTSLVASLALAMVALLVWIRCAHALGRAYEQLLAEKDVERQVPVTALRELPADRAPE